MPEQTGNSPESAAVHQSGLSVSQLSSVRIDSCDSYFGIKGRLTPFSPAPNTISSPLWLITRGYVSEI